MLVPTFTAVFSSTVNVPILTASSVAWLNGRFQTHLLVLPNGSAPWAGLVPPSSGLLHGQFQ